MIFYNYKLKSLLIVSIACLSYFPSFAQGEAADQDSLKVTPKEQVSIMYGERSYERFVGNQNSVSGKELINYPALDVQEALEGKLPGLFMLQENGNIGVDNTVSGGNFESYIRGNTAGFIVLIDGFERPLANLNLDQIDHIQVLKDPVSKSMYGGRISNGILLITTKRGKVSDNEFHAKVQRGVKIPSRLPQYLNASEFASAYNQALRNDNGGQIPDGLGYSDEAIAAYADQSRPMQYPDVDYYGQFLNNSMNIARYDVEYTGGTDKTRYYFQTGIQNEGGLEKYGNNATGMDMYHVRGNLDAHFNDNIKVIADFSGYLGEKQYPRLFNINTLSSRYPNAYPILVAPDSVGGTASFKDNPYGGQVQSGFIKETYFQMQTNLGFEFNLDNVLKGLSLKPTFALDLYNQQNMNKGNTVGIYEVTSFDEEGNPLEIEERQKENLATSQNLGDDEYVRRWAFNMLTSWHRKYDDHAISADLLFLILDENEAYRFDNYKRQNITARTNYSYQGKYTVEGSLNYAGSSSYAKENRFKLFPAIGAGWVLSKEEFLKDNLSLDFLRLNATWGVMGDGNIPNRLWIDTWDLKVEDYRINSSNPLSTSKFSRIANPLIDWPTIREMDINIEARLFNRLGMKVSYFNYLTKGTLSKGDNLTPAILGGDDFLPQQNFGETMMEGAEVEVNYHAKANNWTFDIATHMTISKSEKLKINELADPNYSSVGDATDDVRGYNAIGYYTKQDINDAIAGLGPSPSFLDPADLRVGNIKYEDVNGDNIIDKYDKNVIGNRSPRLMYGANINIGFKSFELYASFLGYGKFDRLLNNSTYYSVYDNRKYSTVVNDGLPNGNSHPQLTTGTPTNDIQTSSYWVADGSFLKLRNVALSYTLPSRISDLLHLKQVKLYAYGTNLFSISKIEKLDPESLSAGVSDYPLFSTYAGGLSISF